MAEVIEKDFGSPIPKIDCYFCRDEGEVGGCEGCGREKEVRHLRTVEKNEALLRHIPKYYQGVDWNRRTLEESNKEKVSSDWVKYCDQMEKVLTAIKSGNRLSKSVFLMGPRRTGKIIWAYSCLKETVNAGGTIVPLVDTQFLKRFLSLREERPFSKYEEDFSYRDFLKADLAVVSVSHGYKFRPYKIIDMILDLRSRNDRPTIFVSRYSLGELCEHDYKGSFTATLTGYEDDNHLKYPAVIKYLDATMEGVII